MFQDSRKGLAGHRIRHDTDELLVIYITYIW
jgi:hypothetical protein